MTASRSKTRPDSGSLPAPLRAALQGFLDDLTGQGELSASTLAAYGRDLASYLSHAAEAGAMDLADLSQAIVHSHVRHLTQAGRSPATVARSLSSLRRFHDHARAIGSCDSDPTAGLEPPRVDRREPEPLSVDEARRLVSAIRGDEPQARRDRAILEILYAAGLRVSELTALRSGDLLLDNALVRVHGRGARERMVPLGQAAVDAAGRYARDSRPLLVNADSDDVFFLSNRGRPLSRMSVWKTIRSAAAAAAIDRTVSPQTLRHTFAAHLLEGGFGLSDVQQLLGHADISTTQIYARLDNERLQQLHRAYHPRG